MRKDRNTKAEPGFIKRRNKINGQFRAHTIEMLESPAWRALSLSARRVIDRIEIELAHHGGNDNGNLPVTFEDFIAYGINRNAVAPAIREAEALGFIRAKRGRGGNADHRQPNLFFLTFARGRNSHAQPPTDDWRKIKTMEEAEMIAAVARNAKDERAVLFAKRRARKTKNRYRKPILVSVSEKGVKPETFRYRKPILQASTETDTTIYILGEGPRSKCCGSGPDHGGGSAPVADITEHVVGIIHAELDELNARRITPHCCPGLHPD